MQIFNKGQRKFNLATTELEPGKMAEVNDKEGKKLLAMYPEELILASEVATKPTGNKQLEEANKQLEELKADLEVVKADLKAVTEERDELKKQIKELKK